MSLIDAAVRKILANDTTVKGLVAARIYPDRLPAGATLPALTYSLITDIEDTHVQGDWQARVQVSCWSNPTAINGIKSPGEVNSVADAVRSALSHTALQKTVSSWTVGTGTGAVTYTVTSCRCTDAPRLCENETGFYHVPCDFIITYRT